jgi:hypothetical protein
VNVLALALGILVAAATLWGVAQAWTYVQMVDRLRERGILPSGRFDFSWVGPFFQGEYDSRVPEWPPLRRRMTWFWVGFAVVWAAGMCAVIAKVLVSS